jgi:hypothetical protein
MMKKEGIKRKAEAAARGWLITHVMLASIDSKARANKAQILYYSPDEAAGLSVFFTVLYICMQHTRSNMAKDQFIGQAKHIYLPAYLRTTFEASNSQYKIGESLWRIIRFAFFRRIDTSCVRACIYMGYPAARFDLTP